MSKRKTEHHARVGVIGGSGYIGAELLRYLSVHPRVELCFVTANTKAGESVSAVLPNLRGFVDDRFVPLDDGLARIKRGSEDDGAVDAVFLALPHTKSQDVVPQLAAQRPDLCIIDMAGDFRTPDPAGYAAFYGEEHRAPEWLDRFVYGITEFQRPRLRGATLIANPGCFASSLLLALCPLARAGKLEGEICATGITGSSGSGNVARPTTHHPERFANLRTYKSLAHQHQLEVNAFVRKLTQSDYHLNFVPTSGPFTRGVFTTVFTPGIGVDELERIFADAYGEEPLITVRRGSPDLRIVQGTPRSEIGLDGDTDRGVVFVTLDNLGKGAAGQAVQNFNLAMGFDELEGLRLPGGFV